MSYSIECWDIKKEYIYKLSVAKMKILSWIQKNTRKYIIQIEEIRLKI